MALSGRSTRFRLFVILGSVGIWLLAFFPLYSSIGIRVALAPLAIPMLVAAWFYGLRGGLIASLVSIPVSIIMVNLADDTLTRWTILFSGSMAPATVFRIAVACLLGRLRNVYLQVKKSEAALEAANVGLEAQVATRTEELSKQQELLFEGESLAKFGTVQRDLQTGEGWWSDEVYHILGIAPQKRSPTLETFLEHVHPQDRECLKEMLAKVRKTGNEDVEFRIVRSSGEELTVHTRAKIHYDEEGNPVRLIGTLLDITERKQAETKMKITQDRLSSALDGLPGGLWDWNVVTGEVYFSDKWCKSLGYQPEEVNPHLSFWEQIVHPDDFSRVMEQVEAHFRGETEVYQCENRLLTKSGSYRWNLDRGQVVSWSDDGKPLRMVGVDLDINERREAQDKIEKTQRELLSLSKHLIQAQETERRRIALELHDLT